MRLRGWVCVDKHSFCVFDSLFTNLVPVSCQKLNVLCLDTSVSSYNYPYIISLPVYMSVLVSTHFGSVLSGISLFTGSMTVCHHT